jgi:hypothetical protein
LGRNWASAYKNNFAAKGIFDKGGITTGLKFKLTSVNFGQMMEEIGIKRSFETLSFI